MPNTKDLTSSLFPLKILAYGEPGTGKTLFASTFENVFIFDLQNGIKTLRGLDCEYETIIEADYKKPRAYRDLIKLMSSKTAKPSDTWVFDGLTDVNNFIINDVAINMFHVDPKDGLEYRVWGQVLRSMIDFVDKLLVLPCNVFCTCQEDTYQDELLRTILVRPDLNGQSQRRIPYKFDEVYRFSVDSDGKHYIQTRSDRRVMAKSRLNRLGVLPGIIQWVWNESNPKSNPIFDAVREADKKAYIKEVTQNG